MTSTEKLVERLLEAAIEIDNDGTPSQVGLTSEECRKAADALEAKDARIAELEAALEEIARFPNPPTVSWERANAVLRRAASARGRA